MTVGMTVSGGFVCHQCGVWVASGTNHSCGGGTAPTYWAAYPCDHCYCEDSYKPDHFKCCKCFSVMHKDFVQERDV
jgi:hypothetical protein